MILGAHTKTMQRGSDLHRTLDALPPRKAVGTAAVVDATGIATKLQFAYLQAHEKRGNVVRHVTQPTPRRVAWAMTRRGRAMLARVPS